MQRALSILVLVVGLVLAVAGLVKVVDGPAAAHRPIVVAPATYNRYLTAGEWDIYGLDGTGQFGSPLFFGTTIVAPNGSKPVIGLVTTLVTVNIDGRRFAESATVRIPADGTYQVSVASSTHAPLDTVLVRSTSPHFPWGGLAIDGLVLIAGGSVSLALDARRRRQVGMLEALYAANGADVVA